MLSEDQQTEFERAGVLHIKAALSEQAVEAANGAILTKFEALGLSQNNDWHLAGKPKPKWPDKGYSTKTIGNKIENVETLIDDDPRLGSMINTLLGNRPIDRNVFKRPQVLVTLPNEGAWHLPNEGWHVDLPRIANQPRSGVQVLALLSEIKPGGGGTLIAAGSHKLLNTDGFISPRDVPHQLKTLPYFKELMSQPHTSIDAFHTHAPSSDLEITELTGQPGDIYLMDMRALHCAAPNANTRPRMMLTQRFVPVDIIADMTAPRAP